MCLTSYISLLNVLNNVKALTIIEPMIVHENFKAIEVRDYSPNHMREIVPQAEQADFIDTVPAEFAEAVAENGMTRTVFNRKGQIVSICGVVPRGRDGISWAVHSELYKDHVIEMTRAVRDFLDSLGELGIFDRFITDVVDSFEGGHKWVKLLRFTRSDEINEYKHDSAMYERLI